MWHAKGPSDRTRFLKNADSKALTKASGEEDNGNDTNDTNRPRNIVKSLDSSAGTENVRYRLR
jgi:hypothetical protein